MILKNDKGSTLVLALIFLTTLMMIGSWYGYQSASNIKIGAGLMRYKTAFRGSLSNLRLGIYSMRHDMPRILRLARQGSHVPYNPFMQEKEEKYDSQQYKIMFSLRHKTRIKYLRKFSTPPPGWMLNAQGGQTKFFSLHYKIYGISSFNNKSNSALSALVVLVTNQAKVI